MLYLSHLTSILTLYGSFNLFSILNLSNSVSVLILSHSVSILILSTSVHLYPLNVLRVGALVLAVEAHEGTAGSVVAWTACGLQSMKS